MDIQVRYGLDALKPLSRAYDAFHLSPISNRVSIQKCGLSPERDTRGNMRIWMCTQSLIEWAYHHLREHHDCPAFDLWAILNLPFTMTRQRRGVYYTFDRIHPESLVRLCTLRP